MSSTRFPNCSSSVANAHLSSVLWAELPDRQEAGTPNLIGAVALGVACHTLTGLLDHQAPHETALLDHVRTRLTHIPGLQLYRLWPADHPRIGVLPFTLDTLDYAPLAAALSAEHGIGVRHGCFCAHPLVAALLPRRHHRPTHHPPRTGHRHPHPPARHGPRQHRPRHHRRATSTTSPTPSPPSPPADPVWTYITSPDGAHAQPDPDPPTDTTTPVPTAPGLTPSPRRRRPASSPRCYGSPASARGGTPGWVCAARSSAVTGCSARSRCVGTVSVKRNRAAPGRGAASKPPPVECCAERGGSSVPRCAWSHAHWTADVPETATSELAIDRSRPIAQVARELGNNEGTLRNWVNQYRRDHAGDEPPLDVSEHLRFPSGADLCGLGGLANPAWPEDGAGNNRVIPLFFLSGWSVGGPGGL